MVMCPSPVGCSPRFDPAQQHIAQAGGRQVRHMQRRRHLKGVCFVVEDARRCQGSGIHAALCNT